MFSKKATKIDKIFTVDWSYLAQALLLLPRTTYRQTDGEDFVNFCGLLRKHELYKRKYIYTNTYRVAL